MGPIVDMQRMLSDGRFVPIANIAEAIVDAEGRQSHGMIRGDGIVAAAVP
jgi:hypothetical protein